VAQNQAQVSVLSRIYSTAAIEKGSDVVSVGQPRGRFVRSRDEDWADGAERVKEV